MTKAIRSRSPIKDRRGRQPGESIREAFDNLIITEVMPVFIVSCIAILVTVCSWVQYLMPGRFTPLLFTWLSLIIIIYSVVRAIRVRGVARNLNRGREGEEAVGQYLEETLRPIGAEILHDIPGDGFNVDHVVIHQSGIYAVETKTRYKPEGGAAEVHYDGEKVTVAGQAPDRDPVVQAKAAARWLEGVIQKSTGTRFSVKPVVLFPGWFVRSSVNWPPVWVQNEKAFASTVRNQKVTLTSDNVHLINFHLKRYVIARSDELRKG